MGRCRISNRSLRRMVAMVYGKKCMLCQKELKMKKRHGAVYHHIIPVSKGGDTNIENGSLLCSKCYKYFHEQDEYEKELLTQAIISSKLHSTL